MEITAVQAYPKAAQEKECREVVVKIEALKARFSFEMTAALALELACKLESAAHKILDDRGEASGGEERSHGLDA